VRIFQKYLRNSLSYSTEHRPLLKVKSSFPNQGQGPPLVSILSQLNPVHTVSSKLFKTYIHDSLPTTHRSSGAVYFLQDFRSYSLFNSFLSQELSANFHFALNYYAVLFSPQNLKERPFSFILYA